MLFVSVQFSRLIFLSVFSVFWFLNIGGLRLLSKTAVNSLKAQTLLWFCYFITGMLL